MAHRIAPRRLRPALRNTAAGLTLISAPVLMFLGVAGPGQAAQAATIATPPAHYVLKVDGGAGHWEFSQLVRITTSGPPKIVLRSSPASGFTTLWSLLKAEQKGTVGRVNFTLTAYTGAVSGTPAEQWDLGGAKVTRMQVSGLKAGGTSIVTLTVTIVANTVSVASEP